MIGVDWGTSNFRAFRTAGGQVVGRITDGPGLLGTPRGGFGDALHRAIAPWLADGERRVLLSGMVGSRQGWVEAPYLPCPADLSALAAAVVPVPFEGADARLVPGLSASDALGVPEVMRGEEVQLFGIMAETGPDAVVCLPGTHSKWVSIAAGRIAGFATHLTGEAFAALRHHTILGRLMADAPPDRDAFLRGVDRAGEPGGLLHHLFGVRALGLFGRLTEAESPAFLSGLLIGHELGHAPDARRIHLCGAPALCDLYAAALERRGVEAVRVGPDAAARGLTRIAEHVEWT